MDKIVSTVKLTGFLAVPDSEISLVQEYAPEHIRLSRAEPGCLKFEFWQDPENPNKFLLDELFKDRAAFDLHTARAKASEWGQISAHLTRHFIIEE